MKKILSLFKRNYDGDRLARDEVVEGCEWVLAGEGVATVKFDGTCCMVRDGQLFKRYDRKVSKQAKRRKRKDSEYVFQASDFKPAPDGWEQAQESDVITGHWPGWLPVGEGPEDQYHREAMVNWLSEYLLPPVDDTYELVGPKVQGNPYDLSGHVLWVHGVPFFKPFEPPCDFEELREYLIDFEHEGIVWHHLDGRMAKVKRKDYGFPWPLKKDADRS